MQLVMGPMPPDDRKVPPDVQVYDEVKLQRYVRKTISFASEAGDRVPALLCLHQTTALGKPYLPWAMSAARFRIASTRADRSGRTT
jgi:hypothetical protein